jgi:dihydrofolate reductase
MGKLIYSAIASLDGYVADEQGKFDWGEPDEEVHTFFNDLERPVGTYLYGRRLFEVMLAWENLDLADQPPFIQDFAEIWRAADKIVYSKTLEAVSSAKTRIERDFDPEAVRELKATAGRDLAVGGPELAAHAFRAGLVDECRLVDECHFFVAPVVVGGGNRCLSRVHQRLAFFREHRMRAPGLSPVGTSATQVERRRPRVVGHGQSRLRRSHTSSAPRSTPGRSSAWCLA